MSDAQKGGTMSEPGYALCPHGNGNDFVYECPKCYSALQSRYDRLREIANQAIGLLTLHNRETLREKLAALDAEVRNG